MHSRETLDEGFDRLQKVLLAMHAGDELTPADAARLSGLDEGVCRSLFEGLTRAGLMSAEADGRFVRQTLDVTTS